MKGIVYRSAALALACMVALSALAVPVSATDYQSTYNFWNWAYDNSWFLGKAVIGFSAGNVCQVSEDGLHHATTHSGGGGSVDGQRVYNCVCDLCGQEFQAVATDLAQTYSNYVFDLPASGIDSNNYYYPDLQWQYIGDVTSDHLTVNVNYNDITVHFIDYSSCALYYAYYFEVTATGIVEFTTAYLTSSLNDEINDCFVQLQKYVDGKWTDISKLNPSTGQYTGDNIVEPGYEYRIKINNYATTAFNIQYGDIVSFHVDLPSVRIAYLSYDNDNTVYVNDRPSTFVPSFSYDDDNGTETVSDQQIIDEQGLNYYNPVTNTTTNITNWTYDYSDRSFTCTTENNTTTIITYGDEYITINEGDVNNTYITYNIYYYTAPDSSGDGSGSGSDGEGSGSGGSGDSSDDGDGIGGGLGELLGSLLGGLIDLITGLISGLIDSLINLVEMTIEKLGQVVNLFGEFGDALKVLWSWLPDEVVTILAAGVSVVVFASVIKLFV